MFWEKFNLNPLTKNRITFALIAVLLATNIGLGYTVYSLRTHITSLESGDTLAASSTKSTSPAPSPTPKDSSLKNATPTGVQVSVKPTSMSNPPSPPSGTSVTPTIGPTGVRPTTTINPSPTAVTGIQPYPGAPACPASAHSNTKFHTLWDPVLGCHYDHEHGQTPFTTAVANMFPGFNLSSLLGVVEIGHTNPSSPMENTMKHGGFKWQVSLSPYNGCSGYQGSATGINGSVVQWHNFGDYTMEFEARVHSALGLLRQCRVGNPTDYGYIYTVQFMDYGQRVVPYQGIVLPYPDRPNPGYDSGRGAYFTVDCFGNVPQCRASRQFVLDRNANANSIWTTQSQGFINNSHLFEILFRVRDNYQLLDYSDLTYPFTFRWLCSADGGLTYSARAGCRYNNSASAVHEIYGTIPASWDNLAGFDTDTRVGRITAEGFVTRFGTLARSCTRPGTDCFPVKMVRAFVGYYGSLLIDNKINQFSLAAQPERDIYFCGNRVCAESDFGAVSSGWIGQSN